MDLKSHLKSWMTKKNKTTESDSLLFNLFLLFIHDGHAVTRERKGEG